jgi:DNA-directed RNA polymerase subunit RPC12/RpoP
MKTNYECPNCGASLEAIGGVISCPKCGRVIDESEVV